MANAVLAQNKILMQQLEALLKQISKQLHLFKSSSNQILRSDFCASNHPNNQCSYPNPNGDYEELNYCNNQPWVSNDYNPSFNSYANNFAQSWRQNPNQSQGYNWREDAGPSNYQQEFQHQQQPHYHPLYERKSKFEDILEEFTQMSMSYQRNTEASIQNLETQVGQLAKQSAEQRASGQFSANTQSIPKEQSNEITSPRGEVIGKGSDDHQCVEEEVLAEKENEGEQKGEVEENEVKNNSVNKEKGEKEKEEEGVKEVRVQDDEIKVVTNELCRLENERLNKASLLEKEFCEAANKLTEEAKQEIDKCLKEFDASKETTQSPSQPSLQHK